MNKVNKHLDGFSIEAPEIDDGDDIHRNVPIPSDLCFYGLVGQIAKAGSDQSEAHPVAIAANTMALLGVAVGPAVYLTVGDSWQHANLFWCHVGSSGDGRKGTAKSLPIGRIAKRLSTICEEACPQVHDGALASGEGVAIFVHDGYKEGKNDVPAIEDKRLLVVLEELDGLLTVSKREGNTLSAVIRGLWDSKSIRPATKGARLWATNPHIGMTCDVTAAELRERLAGRDLTNGFANRFIFFFANRPKLVPNPKPTPMETVDKFAQRIREIVNFAGAEGVYERDSRKMVLTDEAMTEYERLYLGFAAQHDSELIKSLLVRRPAVLLRMSMLFALTDQTLTVNKGHIDAAAAWVQFWADSVRYIFSSDVETIQVQHVSGMASKLLDFLKRGKATRTDITRKCFAGNQHKSDIDQVITSLLSSTPPKIKLEEVSTGGQKAAKFYSLNKSTYELNELTKSKQPRGFAGDSSKTNPTNSTNSGGSEFVTSSGYEQPKQAANPHESTVFVSSLSSYPSTEKTIYGDQFKAGSSHLNDEIF